MVNSTSIEKEDFCSILKPIRFKPSEVKKINSLREVKKGKLEPFAKALHRFIKNAIYLDSEELARMNETTQEYGILPTPNNPKISIMRFIEVANSHNGDNSKARKPAKPKRQLQPSRRSKKQTPSNDTFDLSRTLPNGGVKHQITYKRDGQGRRYFLGYASQRVYVD